MSKKKYVLKRKAPPTEHTYKVLVQVFEDEEVIASHSTTALAPRFSDSLSVLDVGVAQLWALIKQWAFVANEEKEK